MYSYEIVTEYLDKDIVKQQSETIVAENDNDVFIHAIQLLQEHKDNSLVAIIRRQPIVKIIRKQVKNEKIEVSIGNEIPKFKVHCFPCGKDMRYVKTIGSKQCYQCDECLNNTKVSVVKEENVLSESNNG